MRILYDHIIFARQQYGGISKYFTELFANMPSNEVCLTSLFSDNQHLIDLHSKKQLSLFSFLPRKIKFKLQHEIGMPYTLYNLKYTDWDIFHPTSYWEDAYSNVRSNKPVVVTAHDALYNLFNVSNPARDNLIQRQQFTCDRADKIIAISENTKKDYIEYFKVDPNKITVIYHGIETNNIHDDDDTKLFDFEYLLYVGLRHDYKNFISFIHAFSDLSTKYPELKVICTGTPFTKQEMELIYKLKIQGKVISYFASELEMNYLYRNAKLFVFPSKYEGFGMPILEAMTNKCPVALSNTSCFPEIAGDAGNYFDPYSVEDISMTIQYLLNNDSLRNEMVVKGIKRAEQFSWKKNTEEHRALYKSLL